MCLIFLHVSRLIQFCRSGINHVVVFAAPDVSRNARRTREEYPTILFDSRLRLKCDGTRVETRFRLSAKRAIPFKPAGGVSSVDYWKPSCAGQRTEIGLSLAVTLTTA